MSSQWTPSLVEHVRAQALAQGFDLCGVASAHAAAEPGGALTAQRFTAWIAAGRAGEMDYLKRRDDGGELLRASARQAMPWARSVIVCALNYSSAGPVSLDNHDQTSGWIARYAWSGDERGQPTDYHDDLMRRLLPIEAALQECAPCQTKSYVDTGPLLERDFAARAGIGWVGKNTCVLNQGLGSWLLLAVIVTSLEVPDVVAVMAPDRCGSCTRCIDACPTDALVAPREMDASLCIAYLTIEKKGSIADDLRAKMGRQVFGCDICQEVCPWNRSAPTSMASGLTPRAQLINPGLEWLASLDQPAFREHFRGSPLERTKRHRLHRNVAIAMGNSGDLSFVPRLEAWAAGDDPVLAEAAGWAIERLPPVG